MGTVSPLQKLSNLCIIAPLREFPEGLQFNVFQAFKQSAVG